MSDCQLLLSTQFENREEDPRMGRMHHSTRRMYCTRMAMVAITRKEEEAVMVCEDLEKSFDRVPAEAVHWLMRRLGWLSGLYE